MTATTWLAHANLAHNEAASSGRWAEALRLRFNQAAALTVLLLLAPFIATVMALTWLSDGAPLFFAHWRVGRNGKLFRCFKFRTMCRNSEQVLADLLARDPLAREQWARDYKLTHDPRITGIGAFLRRTSLDELPQLFNVLRGEMDLVGPRPITVAELTLYGPVRWHYLRVRPGITGLWQVSGRNNLTYPERVALDRHYVESRSLWLDVQILLRTVKVVVRRDGSL